MFSCFITWEVMYTCSREILKGGRILDQPLTVICSLLTVVDTNNTSKTDLELIINLELPYI